LFEPSPVVAIYNWVYYYYYYYYYYIMGIEPRTRNETNRYGTQAAKTWAPNRSHFKRRYKIKVCEHDHELSHFRDLD